MDVTTNYDTAKDIVTFIRRKNILVIGHNLSFDYQKIVHNFGIRLENLFDTMLAAQILDCGKVTKKGHFTLESTTRRYYDPFAYSAQTYLGTPHVTKKVRDTFNDFTELTIDHITYAALDVIFAFGLYSKLLKALDEANLTKVASLEFDFLKVASDMSINGLPINQSSWMKLAERSEAKVCEYLENLAKIAPINWNSWQQVSKVFKEKNIPIEYFDKKSGQIKESVSKVVLADVADPIARYYIEYKQFAKQASTYGASFLEHINPKTGRIHSSFFQIMGTGRTSSNHPNCQNIPSAKEYRDCFEAPDGYTFVIADYSQQEARLLAQLSEDPTFLQMFYDGLDYHLETAKKAFNNPNLTKDAPERKLAKNTGFAVAFGGGASTIHQRYKVPLANAKDLVRRYFETFPRLKTYFEEEGNKARELGYILIDPVLGRKSYLPDFDIFKFCEANLHLNNTKYDRIYRTLKSEYQRKAQNFRPQGTGASISKRAGVLLREAQKEVDFEITLLVHDE